MVRIVESGMLAFQNLMMPFFSVERKAAMRASSGERKIYDILSSAGMDFAEEHLFPDLVGMRGVPLRFDFAVFDDDGELACLIEFQGRQHYAPSPRFGGRGQFCKQRRYDALKRMYCDRNNIRLVTVPYTDGPGLDYDYLIGLIDR